jgi:hypothetical protein
MFTVPTILIIGAGASHEFGLPLGAQLTSRVSSLVSFKSNPTSETEHFLRRVKHSKHLSDARLAELLDLAQQLASVAPRFPTIDEALHFLSAEPRAIELGKMAIANEIAKAEGNSHLCGAMHDDPIGISSCENSWAARFLRMALSESRRSNISQLFKNVTIVDFNYDRVLPQYLYWALQKNLMIPPNDAAECVRGLIIFHPYGWLGSLDFLEPTNAVSFGLSQMI